MPDDAVLVEERSGALWVIFNRPDKMNPLDQAATDAVRAAIRRAREEEPVALVITGRGAAFCAGADLKMLKTVIADGITPEFKSFLQDAPAFLREIEELPVPVIAGVNGICVAGGMELICACDLVVAAESAMIADGHANFGLLPLGGTANRLARRVGLSNAKRFFFTGDFVTAAEAHRMGLVNWVVPDDQLEKQLTSLCETLYAKSPEVLKRMKLIANHGAAASPDVGAQFELQVALQHIESDTVKEGLAAFSEKRAPQFR